MSRKEPATAQAVQKLTHELYGSEINAHGFRLQPIAQVAGWWGELPTSGADTPATSPKVTGGGAFLTVKPLAIQIEQGGQAAYRMDLTNSAQEPMRRLVFVGAAIALVAGIVNLLIRLRY